MARAWRWVGVAALLSFAAIVAVTRTLPSPATTPPVARQPASASMHPEATIRQGWRSALVAAAVPATQVRVHHDGRVLFALDGAPHVKAVLDMIQFDEPGSNGHHLVDGCPWIDLVDATGAIVVQLGLLDSCGLRWREGWPGDVSLTSCSRVAICRWLADHGYRFPLECLEFVQKEVEAAARTRLLEELAPLRARIQAVIDAQYDADTDLAALAARVADLTAPRFPSQMGGPDSEFAWSPEKLELLGLVSYVRGDHAGARAALEVAARSGGWSRPDRSDSLTAVHRLAIVHADLAAFAAVGSAGRPAEARRRAIDAHRLAAAAVFRAHPGNTHGTNLRLGAVLRAYAAWAAGEPRAAELAREAIALNTGEVSHSRAEDLYVLLGVLEPERRSDHWHKAHEIRPHDPRILFLVAMLKRDEFVREAHADLDRALALAPRRAPAYVERAEILGDLGALPAALADLSRASEIAPRSPHPWVRRALLLEAKHPDEASASIASALDFDAQASEALGCRARLHARAGRMAEAIADYESELALAPDAWASWAGLADILVGLGKKAEADLAYDKALGVAPPPERAALERRRAAAR